jgi:hypothetical protein
VRSNEVSFHTTLVTYLACVAQQDLGTRRSLLLLLLLLLLLPQPFAEHTRRFAWYQNSYRSHG